MKILYNNNAKIGQYFGWVRFCVYLLLLVSISDSALAQQTLDACGGNGLGSGGVTNFSVGQIDFTNAIDSPWSVSEGVQQTYNLMNTIIGLDSVCAGSSITLTDSTPGGTWSSYNPGIASIGAATGIVTGVSGGVDVISYTTTTGYLAVKIITVNALPYVSVLTGPMGVCTGSVSTLTDSAAGGIWTASNGTATVSAGLVTGVTPGTDTIFYSYTNSCGSASTSALIFVSNFPDAGTITGSPAFCQFADITLAETVGGGYWSLANANAGIVTESYDMLTILGETGGTDTVLYMVSNSCSSATASMVVTINPLPVVDLITGLTGVCTGLTTTLAESTTGGTWSATNVSAIVTDGVVSGEAPGVDTINYSLTNSCGTTTASHVLTVNSIPFAGIITGLHSFCAGSSVVLTVSATGGYWSITNSNASLSATGVTATVTGLTGGLDTLRYLVSNSCGGATARYPITIDVPPVVSAVSGSPLVCLGASTTLSDLSSGGSWSATNANAVISAGVVSGMLLGLDTIKYSLTNTCGTSIVSQVVTINTLPTAATLSGATTVCETSSTTLVSSIPGGSWSVSNTTATVDSGVVWGLTGGAVDTIIYVLTNSCGTALSTTTISVSPLPIVAAISGDSVVCAGSGITLSDGIAGGVWHSANGNASVSGGVVTGVSNGTDSILYSVANSCGITTISKLVTINPLPVSGVIMGPTLVCVDASISLSETATGGFWSVSNAHAGISAGIVSGYSGGADTVFYAVTNSCGTAATSAIISINPLADAGIISGRDSICLGDWDTVTSSAPGGIWYISNTLATISASGMCLSLDTGMDTAIYVVTNLCGTATAIFPFTILSPAVCSTLVVTHIPDNNEGISVYPNPNNGAFTINISVLSEYVFIAVYDMYGNTVLTRELNNNKENIIPLDLKNVARATYMLKVIANDKTYTQKLVIVKSD